MKLRASKLFAIAFLFSSLGLLGSCGGSSSSSSNTSSATFTPNNVQQIAVDGGPIPTQVYPDGAFTSVTVCEPGSSNCATVSGILVDTGSVGLRVLASAIPSLSLPTLSGAGGTIVYDCSSFADGSFLWGQVEQADVKIAGEVASNATIHAVADSSFVVPATCSNGGVDEDTQQALGANGILGVGLEPNDCGVACDSSSGGTPPNVYFECTTGGTCQPAFVGEQQQVIHPVVLFSKDNNGVILQFPSVADAAASVTGSLTFGIGTESNNTLPGSATVFTLNSSDDFVTNFNNQALTQSFIDSGSNGLFFPDPSIPPCPSGTNAASSSFYCPTNSSNQPVTLSLSAENMGVNGSSNQVSFGVDNASALFQADPNDAAFSNLAGPNTSGTTCPTPTSFGCSFDWGLPFFYGHAVFTAIDGQGVNPSLPPAPWWAY